MKYLIFSKKIWDRKNKNLEKKFFFSKKMNIKKIQINKPKLIFFIHWSQLIDKNIFSKYFCIQFHCTDLPYGRGGSPVQNLIKLGKKKTFLTAFKIEKKIDSGPILIKRKMSLSGSANDIYKRIENLSLKMIEQIVKKDRIKLTKQSGKIKYFKRRKPIESLINLNKFKNITKLFDFIRMLDAKDYPNANLKYDQFRFYFRNVKKNKDKLKAEVLIEKEK